jgi:hypothetical protein
MVARIHATAVLPLHMIATTTRRGLFGGVEAARLGFGECRLPLPLAGERALGGQSQQALESLAFGVGEGRYGCLRFSDRPDLPRPPQSGVRKFNERSIRTPGSKFCYTVRLM